MFKKKCLKCNNKIKDNYDFCPFCGNNFKLKEDKEDYGFLGKDDIIDEFSFKKESGFIDKMFTTAMKVLEKEMKNLSEEIINEQKNMTKNNNFSNLDIQFFVNGERVFPENTKKRRIKISNHISEDKIEKLAKFPRKEASSKVRRLSGKIIYEIAVPGVESINDILINQLESSIEVKALGKDKVYSKTLNINLPITDLKLNNGNLILELAEK